MEYVRLGDFCEITSSKRVYAHQYTLDGVPFYRSREIIERREHKDITEELYISLALYDTFKQKFGAPQKGDVLLTSVGTLGIPYLVGDEIFYFKDGNLTWMRNFNERLLSKYLFYWFNSKFGKDSLITRAIGSSQAALTIDILKKYKLFLPPINVQQAIISILSAYDDLIENNNRRIKILEKMAENLYKEWFVRFRFPGYESSSFVASSIGRIPEGFSVLKMQDVIDYHIGGGWGSDVRDKNFECEAFVIRGTDFPYVKEGILSTCPRRYHKINNYRTRKLEEGDIILEVSGGTAEQPVGRALLVTKDTLRRFGRKLICASFCKLVRLKRNIISPYYFIYWMHFLYSTRIIEKFQLQSTGIINFASCKIKCDTESPPKKSP